MLIIFKSRATGDVIMFGKVAKKLLEIAGKDPQEPKGIFTVEQLPAAIAALQAAADADRVVARAEREALEKADDPESMAEDRDRVSLFQRAAPLLELMQYSLKDGVPVVWGV